MAEQTAQLFDLVFKKLIFSSPRGVIHLINGLFDTAYPLDSPVEYLGTEHIGEKYKRFWSDTMIRINNSQIYNLEAQTEEDKEMVLRVFEYGYMQARNTQAISGERIRLAFPKPKIIYLETAGKIPDVLTLELEFPDGSIHEYKAGTFKIQEHEPEELFQQKMVLLLPFYILKLRHKAKRAKNRKTLESLAIELEKQLDEIRLLTRESGRTRILEKEELNAVESSIERLFVELYGDYPEFKGANKMVLEDLKTDYEILQEEHAKQAKQYKLDSARKLIAKGVPVEDVAECLNLPPEVVESL